MRMKRMIAWMICAVMLLAMIPAGILTAGAGGTEGDWTVWRDPEKYDDAEEGEAIKPDPGYKYTDEGFTTIPPDWTNFTPFFTVQTKEAQPLKKGIYLQFRVDDYPYGGEDGNADHWISFHLSDREGIIPGSVDYGNNWLCLLRGEGDRTQLQSFVTTQSTKSTIGSFQHTGSSNIRVPMDDSGRGIYTFQVLWTGSAYELSVNGTVVQDSGNMISKKLLEWVESGEYYVGVTMHASIRDASASLTILKYGTCEEDAVTPMGTDAMEPEYNMYVPPDILYPETVPVNQPAILWSPETYDLRNGENISFAVQGDGTWRATASDPRVSWNFKSKASWSYAAEDFPVFGILFRDADALNGSLTYVAGDVHSGMEGNVNVSSYGDCMYYGDSGQYIFIPVDLTGMWEGRIRNIRMDLSFEDKSFREFDICFAGMFRSVEEAYAYTEEYLVERGILTESVSETDAVAEPEPGDSEPGYPDSEAPKPQDSTPVAPETKAPESENAESETLDDMAFIMTTLGCTGSVSGGAVLVLLIGAALLKKKED